MRGRLRLSFVQHFEVAHSSGPSIGPPRRQQRAWGTDQLHGATHGAFSLQFNLEQREELGHTSRVRVFWPVASEIETQIQFGIWCIGLNYSSNIDCGSSGRSS